MSEDKVKVVYSFPIFSVLFVLFLALKLTGHIDWSWWWVTAPLWGPWVVLLAIFLGALTVPLVLGSICWAIVETIDWTRRRK